MSTNSNNTFGVSDEERLVMILDDLKHEIERLNDHLEDLDEREVSISDEYR